MYDADGNGWIDLGEMTRIVKSIYSMMGPQQVSRSRGRSWGRSMSRGRSRGRSMSRGRSSRK